MVENNIEPRTSVTPIKKSMKFQKEKIVKQKIEIEESQFKSYDIIFNGRELKLMYNSTTDEILIEGKLYPSEIEDKDGIFIVTVNNTHKYKLEHHDGQIFLEGRLIEFDFKHSVPKLIRIKSLKAGNEIIRAPLPGQVISFSVKIGDPVKIGQKILTLEAMKMQNEITTPIKGHVIEIFVKKGDIVGMDDKLVLVSVSSNQ